MFPSTLRNEGVACAALLLNQRVHVLLLCCADNWFMPGNSTKLFEICCILSWVKFLSFSAGFPGEDKRNEHEQPSVAAGSKHVDYILMPMRGNHSTFTFPFD